MRFVTRVGGMLAVLAAGAPTLWAHPSTDLHVHAGEVAGLVIVSLLLVGLLAMAGRRAR